MVDLKKSAIQLFEQWHAEASQVVANPNELNAMVLATVSSEGAPSARVVLFKGLVRGGFSFYTNYQSHKAQELESNPHAALVFYWNKMARQVRIEGSVERLTRMESEVYFASRPRESQIGAWASEQSSVVASHEQLEKRVAELTRQYEGKEIPCPPHWGGYLLKPTLLEFWSERLGRLHYREQYREEQCRWVREILAP